MSEYLLRNYEGRARPERLAGTRYILDRCLGCGCAFQRDVPTPRMLEVIYDQWIPLVERDRHLASKDLQSYRYLASEIDFLLQFFDRAPHEVHVLDFGFGWGEWARMAAAWGCRVEGSELSQERIANARAFGLPIVAWSDIPGAGFDFINTEQVLEHIVEPLGLLRHLRSGLAPGGLLKVSVPDARRIDRAVAHLQSPGPYHYDPLMPVGPLEHINSFTPDSLTVLGRRAGLRPVEPGLRRLWNSASGWLSPRVAAKNLVRPLFRHLWPRSTYVLFTRDDPPA